MKENINKNIPEAKAYETGKIEYNGEIYAVESSGKITGPIEGELAKPGEKVTGAENKLYINDGVAVIPVGFAIVRGCDKVSEGLVITDNENDTELDEDLTKHVSEGNQFVWIPVDKNNFATEFVRREGKYNVNDQEKTQDITNYGEADGTGNNTNTSITESSTTQAEAIAMYDSVEENGGFYIGRYEAGTTATSGSGIRGSVVCKKGANVYNNIGWNNDTTNYDITVETGGAVEVARNFASEQGYDTTKVHSTLCY